MKPNLFKYSMLTVGIVTAMGAAHAATSVSYNQEQAFTVKNIATATYNVTGNPAEQKAESNEVTINVTETGAFSLLLLLMISTKILRLIHKQVQRSTLHIR